MVERKKIGGNAIIALASICFIFTACFPASSSSSSESGSTEIFISKDASTVTLQFGEMGVDVSLASPLSKGKGYPITHASKRSLDFPLVSNLSLATLQADSTPAGAFDFVNNIKCSGGAMPIEAQLLFTTSLDSSMGLKLWVHFYYPITASNNTTIDSTYVFNFIPYDPANNPYGVYGPTDLSYIRSALGANFKQMADIDLSQATATQTGISDFDSSGWVPIGHDGPMLAAYFNAQGIARFTGNYDGGGRQIKNLTIHRFADDFQGLFSDTSGGSIKNIGLTGLLIEGGGNTGGLVGSQRISNINQAYGIGQVTSLSGSTVGGLVGEQWGGSVSQVYWMGTVSSSTGSYVGGLVGAVHSGGNLSQVYAASNVYSTSGDWVGGLVGYQDGNIIEAYATGLELASASAIYKGGVAGQYVAGILDNTYYLKANRNYYGLGHTNADPVGVMGVTGGTRDASFAGFGWVDSTSTNKVWTHTGASNGNTGNWPTFGGTWLDGWSSPPTQTAQSLP